MRKTIGIIALQIAMIAGYGQSKNQDMQTQEILDVNRQLFKGTAEKTEAMIRENIADGFLFTTANADVLDKEGYIKGFALHPSIKISLLSTSDEHVTISGSTAILIGVAHIRIAMNDEAPRDLLERITGTYILADGHWKMLAMHATYIPKK
ncbi:nuclear transport factor 2 family protein [Chitinophaga sp. 22321]|uniref:Nuclear transport factor 2 family protein n=1 Tax=Chitinophaga hostae TaxID=2831022 RepID=A0ABS5J6N3_9BACT|nr:nuclear transport factor 2 family protein [Chitinophaga hostae]MBS0030102.1 nuclear transport factor 2 family protein [Chitinophaga hostae]